MKNQINRLEQALRVWEDKCFFFRTVHRFKQKTGERTRTNAQCPQTGPILHWQSLRKHLLKACRPNAEFELEKYCGTGEFREIINLNLYPFYLWLWSKCSRRIYHISSELQLLLRATSLDGVKWGDIKLPFESFAIQLDKPIEDPKSGRRYDMMLVAQSEIQGPRINYLLLNGDLENYSAITPGQRQTVEKDFNKKKWQRISKWLTRLNGRHVQVPSVDISVNLNLMQDRPIEDEDADIREWDHIDAVSLTNQSARVVAGLCLYLRGLPANSPHQSDWERANRSSIKPDSKCVTSEALVCTVSSVHKLTREERQVLESSREGAGDYEVRAHFRCGHWRRPPGLGSDPTAEKTVWVRPTLVRRDRVEPGSVPGGSETQL